MAKTNMKELAAQVKASQKPAAKAAPKVEEVQVASPQVTQEKESQAVVEGEEPNEPAAAKKVKRAKAPATDFSFDLAGVNGWKRPAAKGSKKMVELAYEYDSFFRKAKVVTGVSTIKFVNYIVRDFLINNPDFVKYINEEAGRGPELE